ncbi:hypothetical protein TorRG33x02_236800 [Trema orientale]|uniref:Uncharacterized protein n=1 Tax=Trema orientale TaxID=63057 RepID=A0A2P5E031_TREOI|nr:hypothetical protein TorRG33x02_236800 [Trema orientale]
MKDILAEPTDVSNIRRFFTTDDYQNLSKLFKESFQLNLGPDLGGFDQGKDAHQRKKKISPKKGGFSLSPQHMRFLTTSSVGNFGVRSPTKKKAGSYPQNMPQAPGAKRKLIKEGGVEESDEKKAKVGKVSILSEVELANPEMQDRLT